MCAAQSPLAATDDFSQPFGQAVGLTGGNPDLGPEEADSWSVGLVWTPDDSGFSRRTSLTVDYFSMKLENVIAAHNAVAIVTRCFNADGVNPNYDPDTEWCQMFSRDPNDGGVIDLAQLEQNQSVWKISGIDTTLNWGVDAGPGELDFRLLASWLEKFEMQTGALDPFNDFAGTIGSNVGTARPDWRGSLVTTYNLENIQLQATTRYIGSMSPAAAVTNPDAVATGTDATWYLDLAGRYFVTDNITLRAGINNVANQQPRLYSPNVDAGTDPSLFDVLGRRFFVGFDWRM